MRTAIVSDIHGNYDAFRKVIEDFDESGVDRVISLGDNIGYGPESDRVVREIIARNIPSVLGNHELAVKDKKYLNWFNPVARKSLIKTRELLSASTIQFIAELEPFLIFDDCRCVHGFPPDSPLIYMFQASENRKKEIFEELPERLSFIGHTHSLEIIGYDGKKIVHNDLTEGLLNLERDKKYIINIGSVGQPRDDCSNDAKYVIYDSTADTIDVRFISYDIEAVVRKIKDAGLPEEHANRLW
jgi:predicted phosphodiesterase